MKIKKKQEMQIALLQILFKKKESGKEKSQTNIN
jgi:hypothetical protein